MRDLHMPGRSTVHGARGVCATSHPAASLAALDILTRGGNAVDAAIAASAVLCVVEPMSTGIGGDCFALFAPAGGPQIIALNGSGRAPAALNLDWLKEQGIDGIEPASAHAVTIPGAVDAWCRLLADHGSLDLETLLQPAIGYAKEGFAVSPRVARDWAVLTPHIGRTEEGRRHFLLNGRAPETGGIMKLPALGKALERIAAHGRDGFYGGPVAQDMVACLRALGGRQTMDDFAATHADYVDPIKTRYGPWDVVEMPPNGQGVTALLMLNILSRFDVSLLQPGSAAVIHLLMEAQRLSFEVRDNFVCDPGFADVPVTDILSDAFADRCAARIDPNRASANMAPVIGDLQRDTVYLTIVDKDCNAVSFINSVYTGFGSGIVSPNFAVVFQNRGMGFSLDTHHPNVLQGAKRPKHTIIPAMALHGSGAYAGRVALSFGVMGGDYQPVGHAHVVSNMADFGMDPQEALDAPRTFYQDRAISCERGVSSEVAAQLKAMGHALSIPVAPHGGGQIACIDWRRGSFCAGSDPRKDGAALAF